MVVACDANTIATASVGALHLDTVFTYRIVQGSLDRIALDLPGDLNVTQVVGGDILEWTIDNKETGPRQLFVRLNRPHENRYVLRVVSERVLPAFPASFDLPLVQPNDVIRTSGFLLIGTDSAIKLLVNKAMGLTQVDQEAFPKVSMQNQVRRAPPRRSVFAYQYANMPYTMEF